MNEKGSGWVRDQAVYGIPTQRLPGSVLALVVASVFYNAVLAALNAAGVTQTFGSVAMVEVGLLGTTACYIAAAGLPLFNPVASNMIVVGIGTSIYVSFASQALVPDSARALATIGMFAILGSLSTERQVFFTFRCLSLVVLAFLVLELVDTSLYVKLFQPASYYANTRGIEEFSLDDSGLFRNALGFQGRFSFGLSSHRTASAFIEQVSLANFSGVLCIYLLACFDRLKSSDRVIHIATVVLVLLTNDSRTSSIFAIVSMLGYFVFPRLPRRFSFAIMPTILAAGVATVMILGSSSSDDLRGRVSGTLRNLGNLDFGAFFGFGARRLSGYMDSGYPYVIASSTIVGLFLLWIFLASAIRSDRTAQRRCLIGLNIYMCANLMIGGTAVFSLKVAAPLWLLIGYMGFDAPARSSARLEPRLVMSSQDPARSAV